LAVVGVAALVIIAAASAAGIQREMARPGRYLFTGEALIYHEHSYAESIIFFCKNHVSLPFYQIFPLFKTG
jgi:hypothetical protein